jgi:serine/threonine protein kinase
MPVPTSVDEFLALLTRSKVVERKRLAAWLRRFGAPFATPEQLANRMLVDGLLTPFQMTHLLQGKWRGYFVGHWKVLGPIGSGRMGAVYLCEHRHLRRQAAIKILLGIRAQDQTALGRFEREARAAAALDHPNIVHAFDVGCEDGLHYLVMEYVNGVSLRRIVEDKGPLPPAEAARYLHQAALGLQHAHEAGLVHRDIRPSNLMVDGDGIVKILDFELARFDEDESDLTRVGRLGSLPYIAPEQAEDSHRVDSRADIYSLGATFYLCLTGKRPRPGMFDPLPRPRSPEHAAEFARLMQVLQRMMAPAPDDRYQSAAEVAETISAWWQATPAAVPEPFAGPPGSATFPADVPEPSCSDLIVASDAESVRVEEDTLAEFIPAAEVPPPPPSPAHGLHRPHRPTWTRSVSGWLTLASGADRTWSAWRLLGALAGGAISVGFGVVLSFALIPEKTRPAQPIPGCSSVPAQPVPSCADGSAQPTPKSAPGPVTPGSSSR